jgi:hypothetical protein
LSIKIASSHKTKTFNFRFHINTTGAKLKNILQSKALASVKKGEALHFEPNTVPVTQGNIVHVGDILLKDATVTHRAHYTSFLRKCKLPDDMPEFDIKLRHKDPLGVKAPILIVRCGTTVATKVAEILSKTLNGQGDSREIFISKLGLGASKMSRATLTSLYEHHHSYVRESVHLPFKTARNIVDSIRTEYFDDGKTCERSQRNWADRCNLMSSVRELILQTEPLTVLRCSLLQQRWRTLLKSSSACMNFDSILFLAAQPLLRDYEA